MIKKKRSNSLDNLKLTNPQKAAVARVLASQKNKYKKLLHEAHERLHIIADMTTSLEFWYNVNGNYEYVSRSSESVLGFPPEAFTRGDKQLEQLVHPDYMEQFRSNRAEAMEGQRGEQVEYRIFTADGSTRWVLATWNPVQTRKGKQIGIRISLRDITEFKQCQYFARAYEQLSLTIANELTEAAIFSVTPDGTVKSWNRGAVTLLGWEKDAVIGGPLSRVTGEDQSLQLLKLAAENGCGGKTTTIIPFMPQSGGSLSMNVMMLNLCDQKEDLYQITFLARSAD